MTTTYKNVYIKNTSTIGGIYEDNEETEEEKETASDEE